MRVIIHPLSSLDGYLMDVSESSILTAPLYASMAENVFMADAGYAYGMDRSVI